MARFYRTTAPERLDFMYQLPEAMMLKAVQTADAQNDAALAQASLYGDVVKVPYMEQDKQLVTDWTNQRNKEIDTISEAINSDPANWRKNLSNLRDLGRGIQNDLSSGEIAKAVSNYNIYTEAIKKYDKYAEENMKDPNANKGLIQAQVKAYKNNLKNSYPGLKNADGTYNTVIPPEPVRYTDLLKEGDSWAEGMKANGFNVTKDSITGGYIVTDKQSGEKLTSAEIANNLLNFYLGNDRVMSYLKDGSKYGYTPSLYDDKGEVIKPFSINEKGEVTFDTRSPLAAPIAALTGKYDFAKITGSRSISEEPYGMEEYKHSLKELDALRDREWDKEDSEKEFERKKELEKLKFRQRWALDPDNRNPDGSLKPIPKDLVPDETPIPLVADQMSVKATKRTELDDATELAALKKQRDTAVANNQTDDILRLNAQIYNRQQDVNKARALANEALLKAGYSQGDIQAYNDYQNNKPRFEKIIKEILDNEGEESGRGFQSKEQLEWQRKAEKESARQFEEYRNRYLRRNRGNVARSDTTGLPPRPSLASVEAVIGKKPELDPAKKAEIDWGERHLHSLRKYDRMEKIQSEAKKSYYDGLASSIKNLTGVLLQGTEGEKLKNQVLSMIKGNTDAVTLIDAKETGLPAKVKIPENFDKVYDIESVIPYQGTSFKVKNKSTGKEYLMQISGSNNLDHMVYAAYSKRKDIPGVDRALQEITNTYKSSILYGIQGESGVDGTGIQFMQPGDSKVIPLNSQYNIKIDRQPNGNFSAFYLSTDGKWLPVPIDGVPLSEGGKPLVNASQEYLADQLAAAAVRQPDTNARQEH